MKEHRPRASPIRFGVYEVDLVSEELRKNGLKIRLSGQPFQILALLLERPGQVVTREELQKELWSDGTFVDFDHSLNTAINKIREALGDSAENPRFVETLARRGYRFVAPVQVVGHRLPEKPQPASAEYNNSWTHEASKTLALEEPAPKSTRTNKKLIAFFSVAVLLAGAAAVAFWRSSPQLETAGTLKLTRLTSDSGLTTDGVISSDGKLVAFASDRSGEGNLDIWVKQIAGSGPPIRLTTNLADDVQPDFSPDGSQIVFRSERNSGGLYLISALGGNQRLFQPHGRNPRFSPDGNWIAYWTGLVLGKPLGANAMNGSLFVAPTSGGGSPRRILWDFVSAGCPIWSPDGKYLLFFGNDRESFPHALPGSDWWVVSREGENSVKTGAFDALGRQQIELRYPGMVPLPTQWIGNLILFSAQLGDSVNLWQVSISPGTWQVTGPAQQLTSGAGLEIRPSLAKDGTLVFSSLTENGDLWSLPLDANRGNSVGGLEQLTTGNASEYSPSISADGKTLAFVSDRSGNPDIWIKNLDTSQETHLTVTQESEQHPEISSDGSLVAYSSPLPSPPVPKLKIQVVPTAGGVAEDICERCGWPWDFTPDSKHVIYAQRAVEGPGPWAYLVNISTRNKIPLIRSVAFQTNFSPDGRWVVFGQGGGHVSKLFVAPLEGEAEIFEKQWIPLNDGHSWDDKPRWSPDGNLVYFTSDRDGFICLWAQRLNSSSKRPKDAPFPIHHFHQARRSLNNTGYYNLELSVARDKIVFSMAELTGNVWMMKLDLK
jgi:eukaryotic-like serine/threonine-protein kinase